MMMYKFVIAELKYEGYETSRHEIMLKVAW